MLLYWEGGYMQVQVKIRDRLYDPWVHFFAGSDKEFSRHWFSTKLSSFLELIAVKHASLIYRSCRGVL